MPAGLDGSARVQSELCSRAGKVGCASLVLGAHAQVSTYHADRAKPCADPLSPEKSHLGDLG
jgi:hypothetical protein